MEVSLLARDVMLASPQRLSISLQNGICFFHPPLPLPLSAHLAVHLPSLTVADWER
jgi:hypothetical protein